jgi:hypothetical protein
MSHPAASFSGMTFPSPGPGWQSSQDLLWISDGPPQPGQWGALRAQHEQTGRWPVLLSSLSERDPGRPWAEPGDLFPANVRSRPGDHQPAVLLRDWWQLSVPEEAEMAETIEPFAGGWPGLAAPGVPQADPDQHAAAVADRLATSQWLTTPRLGLIPAARGADAPAEAGWAGPANFEGDTAKISAVVRSWEDRFGARVIGIGFATLHVSVAAPPTGLDHALRVAAEHHAFCPDTVNQGTGSLQEYAESLVGADEWAFWWD